MKLHVCVCFGALLSDDDLQYVTMNVFVWFDCSRANESAKRMITASSRLVVICEYSDDGRL